MWQKLSEAVGSAPTDPVANAQSSQPVPPPVIANKPAPGRTGPRGLAPRTTYSRTHSMAPPTPDAGGLGQKSQPPRGMEFLPKLAHQERTMTTAMKRPTLHEIVKEAAAGTISKVDIDAEAELQLANMGLAPAPQEKTAAAQPDSTPSEYLEKLAGALDYGADLLKQADIAETKLKPGEGPNALEVLEAPGGENPVKPGNQGQATPKNVIPMSPPVQASGVAKDPANAMATNDAMMHGEQPVEPISNEKAPIKAASAQVLYLKNQAALGIHKEASPQELLAKNLAAMGLHKQAEDALSPAKISAPAAEATGSDAPAAASPAEEGPAPSEPSDVNKQKALIASNQAAMDYKKVQAKADPKSDMKDVVTEPALSAGSDKTLNMVFDKTREAGAKIASDLTRTAAAQVLLAKHAAEAEARKAPKKEKQSQMGGGMGGGAGSLPTTPQEATGMSTGNQ